MIDLTAHRLRFEVEAVTPVAFHPYTGSALRGALIQALQKPYCPTPEEERATPEHRAICPVCWLLAYESQPGEARRPYTIEPVTPSHAPSCRGGGSDSLPPEGQHFEPGQRFTFGITLLGQAVNLFPYLALAVPEMGRVGVGKVIPLQPSSTRGGSGPLPHSAPTQGGRRTPLPASGRGPRRGRGRFVLRRIEAVNPLTGEQQTLMGEGQGMIQMPQVAVTGELVEAEAQGLAEALEDNGGRLTITFFTPTRIVDQGELCHHPAFRPLFQRLFERVRQLCTDFGGGVPEVEWDALQPWAEAVALVEDETRWWDVHGHSQRLGRPQPLGGFVGRAVYQADDWRPLLPWLLWGVCVHVGKNAVKGSGMLAVAVSANGWGR